MFVSNKLCRFIYVAMCALILSAGSLLAQNVTVTGKVVDKSNEPVIGAYVVVAGTTTGTSTGVDGSYSIKAPSNGTLQFTCIGYKTQEVMIAGRKVVDITQKKANLTGAVASIDASKQLDSRPIPDVARGLQGATPGLNVVVTSTEVGSDPRLRIRGQVGSYEGSSAPLILLDNVEIPSLSIVNPNDVESISVLKDAASASIYGAKAAFGVVLITTKKGSVDESIHVNYSGNVSFQNVDKRYGQGGIDAIHYRVLAAEIQNMTDGMSGGFWLCNRDSWKASKAWLAKYADLDPYSPFTYGRDFYIESVREDKAAPVKEEKKAAPAEAQEKPVMDDVKGSERFLNLVQMKNRMAELGIAIPSDYIKIEQ